MAKVLNKREHGIPTGAVYVGRPSKWGNPFHMASEKDRLDVLMKYQTWLLDQPELVEAAMQELRGKDLVCWCAPKACHASLLLWIANLE
jgi:hypothetical protein